MLDDLLEIAQGHSPKDYRNMEGTLLLAMKFLSKIFLQLLHDLSQLAAFCKLWLGVLSRMTKGVLVQRSVLGGDSLWELTWLHVNDIALSLQSDVFPDQDSEQVQQQHSEPIRSPQSSETLSAAEAAAAASISAPQEPSDYDELSNINAAELATLSLQGGEFSAAKII
ncbi:hypothetical protein Sjap_017852 [Stephania japonica]|uniref:Uncharacterized protein n=1 Tax=Stephania japonica TaxID=461633 RepID=A0AAP0NIQ8_9MAGN